MSCVASLCVVLLRRVAPMRRQENDELTKTSFFSISVVLIHLSISWIDHLTSVFNFLTELIKLIN